MNIYDIPDRELDEELCEILLKSENIRIERIVSDHHSTGWYDQDEDEWVCLLSGEADIEFDDKTVTLKCGEHIFLPAHKRHRVARTTRCIWLCVFSKQL